MEERKSFMEKYLEDRNKTDVRNFWDTNKFNILRWIMALPSAILAFFIVPTIFPIINSFPGYPSIIPKALNLLWEQFTISFVAPFLAIYTASFIVPKYKYIVSVVVSTLVITFYIFLNLYLILFVKISFIEIFIQLICFIVSICTCVAACKIFFNHKNLEY